MDARRTQNKRVYVIVLKDSVALVWNDLHNSSVPQMLNDCKRMILSGEKKTKDWIHIMDAV